MASQPDSKHLLELLQRAAEELKTAQKDAAAARAEVNAVREAGRLERKDLEDQVKELGSALAYEKAEVRHLKEQLNDVGGATLRPGAMTAPMVAVSTKTIPIAKSLLVGEPEKKRDDKTNVNESDADLLTSRVKGLQDEIQQLEAERKNLKERVRVLEVELATPKENPETTRQLGELEHELSNARQQLIVEQARGADLLTRLQAWEVRSQELEQSLVQARAAGDEEHAQLDQLAGQLSQIETELTTERARTGALEEQLRSLEQGTSDEQKRLFEATSRIATLEVEIAGLKGRRDELNIEIGKVENERNAARAKATELETAARDVAAKLTAEHQKQFAAEHQKRNELEQQLSKEKEKHQITAQKLLEARGKQRESDEHLSQLNAKVTELSASVERERALREQSLIDLQGAHEANVRSLQQHVLELTSQLENATAEWRHTDRQYEALHREMLAVLDQRDQARQELDAIKQRLGPR
jgi:chromosome segregation ATPase